MIVVADASPLRYLVLLEKADILHRLFGRVLIPSAVANELNATQTPEAVKLWMKSAPIWLEIVQIAVPDDKRLAALDAGEHEAIALAEAMRADALVIDEKAGRQEAERRNLLTVGTVWVLDEGARLGLLELPVTLSRLRTLGFYLDERVAKSLIDRDAARRQRGR